uniref:Cytochrome c oxidase assembly factor 4 homolog n=1 Tax=Otus sunia TaxID=257818 RepID=A0A8C8ABR9_9STRI
MKQRPKSTSPGTSSTPSRPPSSEEEEEEAEDPLDALISRTGCAAQHRQLQECMAARRDWRHCQAQLRAFGQCMARRQWVLGRQNSQPGWDHE